MKVLPDGVGPMLAKYLGRAGDYGAMAARGAKDGAHAAVDALKGERAGTVLAGGAAGAGLGALTGSFDHDDEDDETEDEMLKKYLASHGSRM